MKNLIRVVQTMNLMYSNKAIKNEILKKIDFINSNKFN